MNAAAEVLRDAIAQIDVTLEQAIQRAGHGVDPGIERRLDTLSWRLVSALEGIDAAGSGAIRDTVEMAKRVMEAADPEAPLLMLRLARQNLARALRRHDAQGDLATAA